MTQTGLTSILFRIQKSDAWTAETGLKSYREDQISATLIYDMIKAPAWPQAQKTASLHALFIHSTAYFYILGFNYSAEWGEAPV